MNYPATMPRNILFGTARAIEKWCRENNKVRPTLLDLDTARREVKREQRGRGRGSRRR